MKFFNLSIVCAAVLSTTQIAMSANVAATKSTSAFTNTKVGGRAGLVSINTMGWTLSGGGYAEAEVMPNVIVRPSIDYWQKTLGSGGFELTLSDITFAGDVKYVFNMPASQFRPYVIGGLAMHRLAIEFKMKGGMAGEKSYGAEASSMNLGLDLGGGAAYRIANNQEISSELLIRTASGATIYTVLTGFSYSL